MTDADKKDLCDVGAVVQLNPATVKNRAFAGTFLVVTEAKKWGVMGYVQSLGTRDNTGGQAYYRAEWYEFEYCGRAEWAVGTLPEEDEVIAEDTTIASIANMAEPVEDKIVE